MAQFGEAVKEPGVSVVIPLFARIDLVEHQLAAMAGDAEIQRAEIVYMLDSPELADELRAKLQQLSAEYRLPLRMVVVRENAGFAAAVNLGVSAARGADVVIMHSDVIPAMPGWIGAMERAREERNAVAAGALLIYKDDSIEHAGYRLGVEGLVGQPMKGLHFKLIESTTSQAADAVSAACMCVDRAAFDAVGGMTGGFIDGEFEDVDLCLRLMARGGVIAWAPSARLYHLEGQSTPVKEREFAKPYNAWLARQRWTASESTPQAAGA
jgi:GT2 family glycosyltransferase